MSTLVDSSGRELSRLDRGQTRIVRAPQEICQGKPCWCGGHPDEIKTPQGYRPYSAKRAKQWLAERARARKKEGA